MNFAEWADDELANGCTLDDSGDPGYQAATGPDDEATGYKQDFVDLWDSLASEYGLTAYQWNQL